MTTVQQGFSVDINILLVIIAVFLLIPIRVLCGTFITVARYYYSDKQKSDSLKAIVPIGLILIRTTLLGQESQRFEETELLNNPMTIFLLLVIVAELMVILFFDQKTNDLIRKIKSKGNRTGKEQDKPWAIIAFIVMILLAGGYLYYNHIAKSAAKQNQDEAAMAESKSDEYLKSQSINIDESNVPILTGDEIEAGKKTFKTLCSICHKSDGGGLVGPNLTDQYWLHGGALNDLFKTIKFGYPDKGMISWKDQLSPLQIAQVANYILTLQGTNPPDCKAKQGILYTQMKVPADTSSGKGVTREKMAKN